MGPSIRKGAPDTMLALIQEPWKPHPAGIANRSGYHCPNRAARRWWWRGMAQALGVIHLKDIVKGGIKERFAQLAQDGHQDRDDHRR